MAVPLAVWVAVAVVVVTSSLSKGVAGTPLDDYVNAPDPTYHWTLNGSFRSDLGFRAYNIDLTSQTWLTPQDVDRPVWRHWLTVCVPDFVDPSRATNAFLYIDGGDTTDPAPTSVDLVAEVVCVSSRTISAALLQIPDEPLVFNHDGVRRTEDALIAYGWAHFLKNDSNNPLWLARLPMTKAVVKAMDTIQAFAKTLPNVPLIKNFVIAGASKRGWTTWTTGAVDKRVVAMVPMVMPILNIVPNMNHHYQAYGGWSFALDDYLKQGIMAYLNDPVFLKMAAVNDPWSYRDRLTMPKLIMCAAGDEFFLPDSPQFFINELPGEKYLTVIPDAEHSLATAYIDVAETITTFYQLIITNHRPTYSYQLIKSNTTASIVVTVDIDDPPKYVTMWYAYTLSSTLRDFRLVKCGQLPECLQPVIWWFTEVPESSTPGVYVAKLDAPTSGWAGFLVELTYQYDEFADKRVFRVTTEVNIVPDVMPFPPCGNHCQ